MVKFSIEQECVSVNSTDKDGSTALHNAAYSGHNEIVEYLLSRGANVDPKIESGDRPESCGITPLVYATLHGHVNVAKTLIEHGADIGVIVNSSNLLDDDVRSNNPEMIDLMLKHGHNINQHGSFCMTPLGIAMVGDRCESARFLLEKGADYRKYTADDNCSPLHYAVQEEEGTGCMELLLKHVEKKEGKAGMLEYINYNGAPVGRTALHVACLKKKYHAVKLLLEYGADHNIKDSESRTPYDLLCTLKDTHVCKQIKSLLQEAREHSR